MSSISNLRTYADLREYTSPAAFTSAMNFLAWHNRLKMTAMLEPWKALVVAIACESRPIDQLQYSAVKAYCTESLTTPPKSLEGYRDQGERLEKFLFGS